MGGLNGEIDNDLLLAIIASTLLILLLIAGITLAFFISGRQKIKQRIELAEARLAFEKELRAVETEVTESVMSQFAQELHDNIGQLLTGLHIQIENQKLDHPELADSFKPAESSIVDIGQQLRMLSRTLNNDYLGHIGLLAAIQLEVKRIVLLKRFEVFYEPATGNSNLEKNQELMVFRIFQEIMQNALKHSRAKNVQIHIVNHGNNFSLQVKDDGKGFDLDAVLRSDRASGLRNLIKRAELAALNLQMESAEGRGSLFLIKKKSNLA